MDTLCRYEHEGRTLEIAALDDSWPVAAVPDLLPGSTLKPADVTLGAVALSASTIAPGAPLTLSAQVGGKDVAFVYLELLLRDPAREQYYGPVYREAMAAPATKTVGGVTYPDWSAAPMAQVTFEPVLRLLTDGARPPRASSKRSFLCQVAQGQHRFFAIVAVNVTGNL